MIKSKDVVAGLGEIGYPIMQLISKAVPVVEYDINVKLMDQKKFQKYKKSETRFLHICIPFTKNFISNVTSLNNRFQPQGIIIHSTISPGTTTRLQKKLTIPIIYSATRGVHKRMLYDLRRYVKFYAIDPGAPKAEWAASTYERLMAKCKVKTKRMSKPIALELAKIVVDTSYYGWLITYAQLSNMIALEHSVDYDEMWSFSDEIHKFLGNRPKMFPGFIGGHCVIPNLNLIHNQTLDLIKKLNSVYARKVKNAKFIEKKYSKN